MRPISKLYNEEQLRFRESLESTVRGVGGCVGWPLGWELVNGVDWS
jgi:hypothetical protein